MKKIGYMNSSHNSEGTQKCPCPKKGMMLSTHDVTYSQRQIQVKYHILLYKI